MIPLPDDPVRHARLRMVRVTDRTIWSFLSVVCASGTQGVGEASLAGRERALADAALEHLPGWLSGGPLPDLSAPVPIAIAALATAFDIARADAAARRDGIPLAQQLGGDRATIPVYANINRRTRDRTPTGFAESARGAAARGFTAVKIAPFDEVMPDLDDDAAGQAALAAGLCRIGAVRAALGEDARLMVDCHWRFSPGLATRLVEEVAPYRLHWLECPLVESKDAIPALVELRRRLNSGGVLLAGLEELSGAAAFTAFADAGAYDVMMPDMKYVGGLEEMLRTATALAKRGVAVSPHNPTGPICHATSLQVCTALPGFDMLEMQLDETDWFRDLATPAVPVPRGGVSDLPSGPGIGVALDEGAIERVLVLDITFGSP